MVNDSSINKRGKILPLVLSMDIIGFALVILGAAMIRLAKDEIFSILGGFVMAGGVALLSITRLIQK
ncbi:hypothetical protein J4437_07795 [Candidatus Woesearchaeota archaeon]|nr:hypothetical protein [Candidatus Woesearchaeota archaeon]